MILSENDMRRAAPAIFSEQHSMSRRYAQIATSELLRVLGDSGYVPVSAQQDAARLRDPRFVTHSVVLRHEDHLDRGPLLDGDAVPQILITNSHNGRSQLRMRAGIFRFVCANGLVVGDTTMVAAIPHRGSALRHARVFATAMGESSARLGSVVRDWSKIVLTPAQRQAFAREAAELRYGKESAKSFELDALLAARRDEDKGSSLWNVFNVLQENTVKGGVLGVNADGRQVTSRPLGAITPSAAYNASLWNVASRFAGVAA